MNQKYLKKGGLITLITLLSMIPPLSTDLYMPALPQMSKYFGVSTTLISFTMTIFFIFMAIGILVLGSISDKYGRKPILLTSIIICMVFSFVCAFAPTISFLIIARSLQAFGAGGMVAISTALIKDSFKGKEMSNVISISQALMLLAPMIAPVIGAVILKFASWQMIFIALTLIVGLSLIGTILLQETLPQEKRTSESAARSLIGLAKVAKNKNFSSLLLIGGFLFAPLMAYIVIASFIYINGFGVTETTFSIYFAITSATSVLGPVIYMRLGSGRVKPVINFGLIVIIVFASLILLIGDMHPLVFLLCFIPFSIVSMYFRPMISDILLATQKTDVGAASAVMNFGFTIIGSIGMMVGSMKWASYINGLSYTMLIFVTLTLIVWLYVLKSKLIQFDWKQKYNETLSEDRE